MPARPILAWLLVLLAIGVVNFGHDVLASEPFPSFLYTAAPRYEPLAWMRGAERFPSGATIWLHDATGERSVVTGFAASEDPAISLDGQNILFAGKLKAGDPWQIWELPLSGGEPRRITAGSEDCIRPFYLPDGRVIYSRRIDGRFVIEAKELSGGKPLVLTYAPANFLPTDILRDGRILFEAAYPLNDDATPELYTVYSDGSGVESYRCDHGAARYHGKQIGSGDIVFASRSGMARFASASARQIPISVPAGEYAGDIAETNSGDWLIAWRARADAPFQIRLWTPGATTLRVALSKQNVNLLQPVLARPRIAPNRHPSGLHDWPNANLLCLNAYTSKTQFADGSIHSMRLYMKDEGGNVRLLGSAPVERDGSFFVHVPSERPLQIELLDDTGRILKREKGFFWMRRGEQRACVGCHAGPETSPENAVPMILRKSTTPADLTGGMAGETTSNDGGER